jgi:hypothetical protein
VIGGERDADGRSVPRALDREIRGDVDRAIERRVADGTEPPFRGDIDDDPHDVALLDVHLADHQFSAPRRGLPRDLAEGVAGDEITDLSDLGAVAATIARAAGGGIGAEPSATRRTQAGVDRARDHLEAQHVGERQRHLERGADTARTEREAVHATATDAPSGDLDLDVREASRENVELGRTHDRAQSLTCDRAQAGDVHDRVAAIAQLRDERARGPDRDARATRGLAPHHLEAGAARARDIAARRSASPRDGRQQRSAGERGLRTIREDRERGQHHAGDRGRDGRRTRVGVHQPRR